MTDLGPGARLALDSVFTWGGNSLKFGVGALDELGHDALALGLARVLVVSDPGVLASGILDRAVAALSRAGVESVCYTDIEVEPTDASIRAAAAAVEGFAFEGIVAVGGGSVIDTAKGMNLLRSCLGDLLDYVNAPIGAGRRPERPVLPLIAVPTTAGSGSEASAVCIMDLLDQRVKSGISDWRLRPTLAVVDPSSTLSLPGEATISSGLDVLCHNIESLTSKPFFARPRPKPGSRPTFSGANPLSDLLCERSLTLLAQSFRRAVRDGADEQARYDVMLAATLTAVGSSTAGVHIPHACSYAIAAQVRDYTPPGPGVRRPFVPHGVAVAATIRAVTDFTFTADPARHMKLAQLLRQEDDGLDAVADEERLSARLTALFEDLDVAVELHRFGYRTGDVDSLVDGTMLQQRLLAGAPREVSRSGLAQLLGRSLGQPGTGAAPPMR